MSEENRKIVSDILRRFPCALGDKCLGIKYCTHCCQDKALIEEALNAKDSKIAELEAERRELVGALEEMIEAMHRYQMDVEEEPPYKHVEMMQRARKAISSHTSSLKIYEAEKAVIDAAKSLSENMECQDEHCLNKVCLVNKAFLALETAKKEAVK